MNREMYSPLARKKNEDVEQTTNHQSFRAKSG